MKNVIELIKGWGVPIVVAILINYALNAYIIMSTSVPTESMVPTITPGDRFFVNKMSDPEKLTFGEIVVFYPPIKGEEKLYIKRLIGIEGDTIEIKKGTLIRNGKAVKETYLNEEIQYDFGPVTVPNDHYLFLGDNRNHSYDSHLWDTPFVSKDAIQGKAVFQYYPFSEIRKIETPYSR